MFLKGHSKKEKVVIHFGTKDTPLSPTPFFKREDDP